MPTICSSADLRNNYNEISNFCHEFDEPIFITKNGRGDLAVMSIDTYEKIVAKLELYSLLRDGMNDYEIGNMKPFDEAMAEIRSKRSK